MSSDTEELKKRIASAHRKGFAEGHTAGFTSALDLMESALETLGLSSEALERMQRATGTIGKKR